MTKEKYCGIIKADSGGVGKGVSAAPKKRVSNAPPFFAKLQELSEILRKSRH
nr:MAG TPA: hypothetical protein [Caudoviricetes sp.]